MNAVELALAKQRLQLAAAAQRADLARYAEGLRPACDAADQLHAGARWIGRHPEVVAGSLAALAAARPDVRRFLWRWSRRGFVAWKLWRDAGRWLGSPARDGARS